jgi:hypothetical protein
VGREGFVVRTTITAVILSTQSRETAVVEVSPSAPVEEVLASLRRLLGVRCGHTPGWPGSSTTPNS